MVIKSVGALSCAKIVGTLYAVIGLLIGACFSLIAMVGGFAAGGERGLGAYSTMFGIAGIVVLPIVYGILGFITTLIGAWLYNVLAGMVGGVELEVQ